MTIEKMRNIVKENVGVSHLFRFHGTRNQIEEFSGVITAFYPAIFIITIDNCQIRSFSYSDLLIQNLEILD